MIVLRTNREARSANLARVTDSAKHFAGDCDTGRATRDHGPGLLEQFPSRLLLSNRARQIVETITVHDYALPLFRKGDRFDAG
jgi:hypothetical protein